ALMIASQVQAESIMDQKIVRNTRTRQGLADCETTFRGLRGPISTMDSDKDIGRRLIAVRQGIPLSQVAFAKSIDVAKNTLNGYETGSRPLPIDKARRICRRYGLSLDWLIEGAVSQPGHEIAVKFGPHPKIKSDEEAP